MPITISEKAVLIRPSRSCRGDMSEREMYEYTRGVCRVDISRAKRASYAFCVLGGEIARVYRIHEWHQGGGTAYKHRAKREVARPERAEFTGVKDKKLCEKYAGKNIKHYFARGNSNPVNYINC